jgi:hypothetical protein
VPPPERATPYGVYRKSHPVQVKKAGSVPAQENAPDPVTHHVFMLSSALCLLFEMGKLEHAGQLVNSLKIERPYSEPGLLLGTSSFTADGWQGSF